MKIKNIFSKSKTKKEHEEEVTVYSASNKRNEIALTKQQIDHYTKSIPIKDVKSYLVKEYDRAFEREKLIDTLQKRIAGYEELEKKYDALLVVQDKKEERYAGIEKRLVEKDDEIEKLKEEVKGNDAKRLDIMANCKMLEDDLNKLKKEQDAIINNTINNAKKDIHKEYEERAKIQKRELIDAVSKLKGHIKKEDIIEIIEKGFIL